MAGFLGLFRSGRTIPKDGFKESNALGPSLNRWLEQQYSSPRNERSRTKETFSMLMYYKI